MRRVLAIPSITYTCSNAVKLKIQTFCETPRVNCVTGLMSSLRSQSSSWMVLDVLTSSEEDGTSGENQALVLHGTPFQQTWRSSLSSAHCWLDR